MAVDERARQDIAALSDTILETREAVTRIERRQNQHGRLLSELQQGLAENNRRLESLEGRFESLEGRFEKRVGHLEVQMEDVQGTVHEILDLIKQKG
jgi:TolA-binding protein